MKDDDMFEIIDPPVTEFSPPQEILAWIVELENMQQSKTVERELESALKMLAHSEALRKKLDE